MNHNVTILDGVKVSFGDNVFIAPDCVFSTAGHPLDTEQRNQGLRVWISAFLVRRCVDGRFCPAILHLFFTH